MKDRKSILMMLALTGMIDVMVTGKRHWLDSDESGVVPKKPKRVIPAGCKVYTFYGIEVVAISEKSAKKKANKILKSQRL